MAAFAWEISSSLRPDRARPAVRRRGLVLFILFVLFLFIRMIPGRPRVAHDHEETPSINLVENSSGRRGVVLLLLLGKASSKQSRRVSSGLSQHFIQL